MITALDFSNTKNGFTIRTRKDFINEQLQNEKGFY